MVAGLIGTGAKAVAAKAAHYGAKTTFVCELGHYNPETFSEVATTMIKESGADVVLASSSTLARDLFPRVAARLDSGLASDCTILKLDAASVSVRKPLYSGKCTAEVEFVNSPIKFVLMRPNQLPVGNPDAAASAQIKDFAAPATSGKITMKELVKGSSSKADLAEANIIVSGGRGMGSADNFKILEDLAGTLGRDGRCFTRGGRCGLGSPFDASWTNGKKPLLPPCIGFWNLGSDSTFGGYERQQGDCRR